MNNQYTFNYNDSTIPFTKFWKKCVGSGHAALGLRADWQEHLAFVRKELGFEYVRFHGLLCDQMKVITRLKDILPLPTGISYQSFYQIDLLFDYILKIGMKPFIELSFMPKALASGKKTIFYYKGNISPPKKYEKWGQLIEDLTRHLVERYGNDEVETWFFEVWNEPNLSLFWSGSKNDYLKLYKYSVEAIKRVNPNLKVGGPSTAKNEWIPDLIDYCKKENLPLDYISTHQYPSDIAIGHSMVSYAVDYVKMFRDVRKKDLHYFFSRFFHKKQIDALNIAGREILKTTTKKSREEAGDLPLYYTEWNSNSTCSLPQNDTPYASAFIIKTIVDLQGLVDMYSFWTFSDVIEELGFLARPFNGSFGMIIIHGIPKPAFWAFKLLSRMGENRYDIPTTCNSETLEMIATKEEDSIKLLLYNQQAGTNPITDEDIKIEINGIGQVKKVLIERIDDNHDNARKIWEDMGSPEYLKNDEVKLLKEKSKVIQEKQKFTNNNENLHIEVSIPKYGVALIEILL